MAGWLHGVFVVDWLFVSPLCGFSLSLFCNYVSDQAHLHGVACMHCNVNGHNHMHGYTEKATEARHHRERLVVTKE